MALCGGNTEPSLLRLIILSYNLSVDSLFVYPRTPPPHGWTHGLNFEWSSRTSQGPIMLGIFASLNGGSRSTDLQLLAICLVKRYICTCISHVLDDGTQITLITTIHRMGISIHPASHLTQATPGMFASLHNKIALLEPLPWLPSMPWTFCTY